MASLRDDFPLLAGRPDLAFLDSAASAQKPHAVLAAMQSFQETSYANVHRGAYRLSQEATVAYEAARKKVARFIGAPSSDEVFFTRGTTTGLNVLAHGLAPRYAGRTVLLTEAEHHANFIPWQQWARTVGATVKATDGRFGASSAHGRANMVRFNFFSEAGAFVRDVETGKYRVDQAAMKKAMEDLSRLLLTLQGDGDYEGALDLTNTKGVIGAELQADLDRLSDANIPVDIRFNQGVAELGLD